MLHERFHAWIDATAQPARRFARWLGDRNPALCAWLGDRPDIQMPALAGSVLTHLVLVLAFAMMGYAATATTLPFPDGGRRHPPTDFARLEQTKSPNRKDHHHPRRRLLLTRAVRNPLPKLTPSTAPPPSHPVRPKTIDVAPALER